MEPQYVSLLLNNMHNKPQNRAYKFFLGVGGKHPLATAAGDVCWMSTKQRHQFQTLTLVLHIAKGSSKKVFVACKNLIEEVHIRNWSSEVKLFCLNVISPGGTATLLEIV